MRFFKKPIFVSVSPNAECDDVWLALRLIFSPWRWQKGEAAKKLEEEFKKYLGVKFAFTFESGRTCLYAILMALGIRKGDEVLIQAFTCTAAVNPIIWVGARPVYVDLEKNTYNMSPIDLEKKITPQSRVIIIQHTFGFPAKIDEILAIAKKYNLIVLEDCAHSLGATYQNQKVGTFGLAAFFSFGRSKIISSVFGGLAVTNNFELSEKIKEFHKKWPYPSNRWIAQQLFHPIYLAIAKPIYNFFNLGKLMIILCKKLGLISIMVYSIEKSGGRPPFGPTKLPNGLAILALNQLRKLERFNEHRRSLAKFYGRELKSLLPSLYKREEEPPPFKKEGWGGFFLPKLLSNSNPVFLNFPIQVKNFGMRRKLIGEARKNGIYLESWPAKDKKVIGPDSVCLEKLFYTEGSCPIAEKTASQSINLPTSPNTDIKMAKRVVKFLKYFFKI